MKTDKNEFERRVERFENGARQAGVKITHQWLEIFREVASSLEHPSAEAVLKALQPRMPTISLDPLYRTFWLLHDLGLVSTLGPGRGILRFDANLALHITTSACAAGWRGTSRARNSTPFVSRSRWVGCAASSGRTSRCAASAAVA